MHITILIIYICLSTFLKLEFELEKIIFFFSFIRSLCFTLYFCPAGVIANKSFILVEKISIDFLQTI